MNNMKRNILSLLTLLLCIGTNAGQPLGDVQLAGRVGYSLGAAAPLGIPASIRKLNSFQLTPNFLVGLDARLPLTGPWGVQAGLRFENKGMDVAVTTKGYHMAMVKGGEELEGVYTGRVEQQTKAWMLTVPLMATLDLSEQWRLHAGPYASLLLSKYFKGNVADGYLRKDNPTGQKIEMGHADGGCRVADGRAPEPVRRPLVGPRRHHAQLVQDRGADALSHLRHNLFGISY